jgi:hypothetical protein
MQAEGVKGLENGKRLKLDNWSARKSPKLTKYMIAPTRYIFIRNTLFVGLALK